MLQFLQDLEMLQKHFNQPHIHTMGFDTGLGLPTMLQHNQYQIEKHRHL